MASFASPSSNSDPNSVIEPALPGDTDDDEFETYEVEMASLTSSVLQHTYENGRRYHVYKHGRYPIPNDDTELEREDIKHAMCLEITNGKLFHAPVGDTPQRIMDLGTGSGQWAIEVADAHPTAEVIGVDLSPIQPVWTPPNLRFFVDDMEDEFWMHGDNFDLIHFRSMLPFSRDPSTLLRRCLSHLRVGGFVELHEFSGILKSDDGSMPEDWLPAVMFDLSAEALAQFGIEFRITSRIPQLLQEAGFQNLRVRAYKVPVSPWPKEKLLRLIGYYSYNIITQFFGAMAAKPLLALPGWDNERAMNTADEAKDLLFDRNVHAYVTLFMWWGQRAE